MMNKPSTVILIIAALLVAACIGLFLPGLMAWEGVPETFAQTGTVTPEPTNTPGPDPTAVPTELPIPPPAGNIPDITICEVDRNGDVAFVYVQHNPDCKDDRADQYIIVVEWATKEIVLEEQWWEMHRNDVWTSVMPPGLDSEE